MSQLALWPTRLFLVRYAKDPRTGWEPRDGEGVYLDAPSEQEALALAERRYGPVLSITDLDQDGEPL